MYEVREAPLILDQEFLLLRAKTLEIAAGLDRIERAPGDVADDGRWQKLRRALEILLGPETNRAERIQLLFSRTYDENWRSSG